LIACLALAAAAVLLVYTLQNRGKTAKQEIAIYVDGQLYATSPLVPGQDLTVAQENGSVNVIRMTENGFFMQSSTCQNQDCIYQGAVTHENWRMRLLGTHVICLPNRVDVMLLVQNTDADVPDV